MEIRPRMTLRALALQRHAQRLRVKNGISHAPRSHTIPNAMDAGRRKGRLVCQMQRRPACLQHNQITRHIVQRATCHVDQLGVATIGAK